MTVDEFIADKIRKRFDLPASAPVSFNIFPCFEFDSGYNETPSYVISINFGSGNEIDYDSWYHFVTDMEVKIKPEPPRGRGIRKRPEVNND